MAGESMNQGMLARIQIKEEYSDLDSDLDSDAFVHLGATLTMTPKTSSWIP